MTLTSRVLLVAAILMTAATVSGRERLELRARPAFAYEPADLQLEFAIVPDAENRALDVVAESYDFYRSSLIELEGERAQHIVSIHYHGLPAGEYFVRGVLLDVKGRERAMVQRQITVMSTGGER